MTILAPSTTRIRSIDILRGIVMVVMALDHVRDFFSDYTYSPTDLQHASTAMFFTRWVTHFCAPIFIFLSGTSAYLSSRKAPSKSGVALKLLTRGLWLIVLELTLVYFGWTFETDHRQIILQVIWAVGWSMIFLSAFIFLPWQAILGIGLLMIFGHDAFDWYNPPPDDGTHVLWHLLHIQGPLVYDSGHTVMVFYPLVPWIGVMAVGYCLGMVFTLAPITRDKLLYRIGGAAILLFVAIRFTNFYGDPSPWQLYPTWWRTVLSFINCSKYPPSLLYLLMTLGPAITALPLLEKLGSISGKIFTVYGRVPLFYYILHIYLVHSMALIASNLFRGGALVTMFSHPGYSLPVVYLFWLLAVAILYLPCLWFMHLKMRHKWWWLSYL